MADAASAGGRRRASAPTSASASAAASSAGRWTRRLARLSPAAGRTRGEWAADAALFAVALVAGFFQATDATALPEVWESWDLVLGAIAALSIWWTRRYPVFVGIAMIVPGALAISAAVGVLVSVYRMGLLAPVNAAIWVAVAHLVTAVPYHAVLPMPQVTWTAYIIFIFLAYSLSLCIGLLGRARRQQLDTLRAQARLERERFEQRLSTIRQDERERLAREMHDVLAHRISLLSMHAGALEYRATSPSPPTADELRTAAAVIRRSGQAAVDDLRELLGVLRGEDELGTAPPQPQLDDLDALVADAEAAGQRVTWSMDVGAAPVRDSTQRTAYRVVQEALTNARKHAPRALVTLRLEHSGDELGIDVRNPVPPGVTGHDVPPGGVGLIGLEERVRIDGGWLQTRVDDGEFVLRVRLPAGTR